MPRRKREEEVPDQSMQQKRPKASHATRGANRKETAVAVEVPTPKSNAPRTARGNPSKPPPESVIEISSESDSLSSPPSRLVTPTPPKSPQATLANGTITKRATPKKKSPKKFTPKEHEDALDFFARGDTDDETNSNSSERKQAKSSYPDLSGDEDEEDWEDVDLSHKRQISLDDLNDVTAAPDLEVTLERTQQSMRIKPYLPSLPI